MQKTFQTEREDMLKVTHSGAYEAREQAKTLQEWFATGAATKKIREGLGVFSLSRKRNGPVMLEATLRAHFSNDEAMFDKDLEGTANIWCTDMGLNIKCSIPDFNVANEDNITGVIDGATSRLIKIQGTTAYMLIDKNTSYSAKPYESTTSIQNMEKMSASEVVNAINTAVSEATQELEAQINDDLKEYRDGTFKYFPPDQERGRGRNINPMVVITTMDNAVDELGSIMVGLESLSDDAHKMYNGKDLFGGDYELDFNKAISLARKASDILSNIKSGELDASDPAQRKTLEQIMADSTMLSEHLSGLWNELASGEQRCQSFFGSGKKLKPVNLAFSPSDFEPDSCEDTAYDIEEEGLKSFNTLKPCVKSFVNVLNALGSEYEPLISEINEILDKTPEISSNGTEAVIYQVKYQKLDYINITE